jgi:hypothetical protein
MQTLIDFQSLEARPLKVDVKREEYAAKHF